MARELIIKPAGIITQPNQIGEWPKGAMSVCADWVFRAPGRLRRAVQKNAAYVSFASGYVNHLLYSTRYQTLSFSRTNSASWNADWITQSYGSQARTSIALTAVSASDDWSTVGSLHAMTMRDRTIVNGAERDHLTFDYVNPSSTNERTPRKSGLTQPGIRFYTTAADASHTAVATGSAVSYCVVYRRKFSDGYELASRPSMFIMIGNNSGVPMNPQVQALFAQMPPAVGDVVQLYRSQGVPYSGTYIDPGSTMYKVAERILTSTDVSNNYYIFVDSAASSNVGDPLAGLGEELYSNPYFGGLAATVMDPPPAAKCIAVFRGRAWYANLKFSGRYSLGLRRPYGVLQSDAERRDGVGSRSVTATATSGNPTLTGISASHILGLAVGQDVIGTHISGSARITSVGASSITLNANATGSGAGSYTSYDVIEAFSQTIHAVDFPSEYASLRKTSTRSIGLSGSAMTGAQIQIQPDRYIGTNTWTIRGSRGDLYDPPIPLTSETALTVANYTTPNGVMYSHDQRPEAVPPNNELQVGHGEILAIIPTRDALWFWCTDGLWRLSGTITSQDGIPDIRVDPIDPKLVIAGPRAWCTIRDRIFAYTNRGLVEIDADNVYERTTGIIGDLLPGAGWTEAVTPFLVANENQDEVWIMGAHASMNFIYSLRYGGFVTTSQFSGAKTGVQFATNDTVALAYGNASTALDVYREAAGTRYQPASWQLQPVFGDRPDSVKQWQDFTVIVTPDSSAIFRPIFNGVLQAESYVARAIDGSLDRRAVTAVPRNAPALGGALSVGLYTASESMLEVEAVSIGYEVLASQQYMVRQYSESNPGVP